MNNDSVQILIQINNHDRSHQILILLYFFSIYVVRLWLQVPFILLKDETKLMLVYTLFDIKIK